jgi:glycosyltransferase involved in cell wall biosynthesis
VHDNVSVILCVKNVESEIKECIASIKKNSYFEIIVVDGQSNDKTVQIAKDLGVEKIISDDGRGLPYARQLGIDNSCGDQILFFGSDNIMPKDFINSFVKLKIEAKFDAASVKTRVKNPLNFWDKGLDFRWKCLAEDDTKNLKVAGTPSMYSRVIFDCCSFTEDSHTSDDADLALQMESQGFVIGLIDLLVYDKNNTTFDSTYGRFKWYGEGDFYFYRLHACNWSTVRKMQSLSHPLRQTFRYILKALRSFNFIGLSWIIVVFVARYHGWISMLYKDRKNNRG